MGHHHICDVAGDWWECEGTALRPGDKVPSVCMCVNCGVPLESGDHSQCKHLVEVVACPEHREEERRRVEEFERRAAEFGLDERWARMKSLPDGPEKHALAEEIVEWLCGRRRQGAAVGGSPTRHPAWSLKGGDNAQGCERPAAVMGGMS